MVLRLHGYGAWIESDGIPLEEYAVEVNDNVISCYVCSQEGKVRTGLPQASRHATPSPTDQMCPQEFRSPL